MRQILRALVRDWHWTALVLCALAIGIGANTALFSIVNGVLLHPLPYPHDARLRLVVLAPASTAVPFAFLPEKQDWSAWRGNAHTVDALATFGVATRRVSIEGSSTSMVTVGAISPNMLRLADQAPLLGRGLIGADTVPGAARVVALSESYWKHAFQGLVGVVGQNVRIGDTSYVVVGVLPDALRIPGTGYLRRPALWIPSSGGAAGVLMQTLVRLRPGVSARAAAQELGRLRTRLRGDERDERGPLRVRLDVPASPVSARGAIWLLWGMGGALLLIACVNVMHLVLFRVAKRADGIGMRLILGETWRRLAVGMLFEAGMLVAASALLGCMVAWLGLRLVLSLKPATLSVLDAARFDWRVGAVTAVIAAIIALCAAGSGLWLVGRQDIGLVSRRSGSTTLTRGAHRMHRILVSSEVALSAVLIVGMVSLVQNLWQVHSVRLGFSPDQVVAVRPSGGRATNLSGPVLDAISRELKFEVSRVPGVTSTATGDNLPPMLGYLRGSLQAEGAPPIMLGSGGLAQWNSVGAEYFAALGLQFVQGRTFSDTGDVRSEVIINETCARLLWPAESAVGRRFRLGATGAWRRVTGVIRDAAIAGTVADEHQPAAFVPAADIGDQWIVAKIQPDADGAEIAARLAALKVAADVPLEVMRLDTAMASQIAPLRFATTIVSMFGAAALALAVVGLYGVLAHSVLSRRREIGLRMALGATPREASRAVIREGVLLTGIGAIIGLVAARWGVQATSAVIALPAATGWSTYWFGIGILLAGAGIAIIIPIRRCLNLSPTVALSSDE